VIRYQYKKPKILFVGINPHFGSFNRGVPFSNNKLFWYLLSEAGVIEEKREELRNDKALKRVYKEKFNAWLDHAAIRELVHGALDLSAGERLVLIKGLVPGLIDDIGEAAFEGLLHEVRVKARRYGNAVAHAREGGAARCAAGRRSIECVR